MGEKVRVVALAIAAPKPSEPYLPTDAAVLDKAHQILSARRLDKRYALASELPDIACPGANRAHFEVDGVAFMVVNHYKIASDEYIGVLHWGEIASGEMCGSCKFWQDRGEPIGDCLRHAPAWSERQAPFDPNHPKTYRDHWCGDYTRYVDSQEKEIA